MTQSTLTTAKFPPGRRVCVRGVEVDLDEVEAELCRHPGVSQAAVIALPYPTEPTTGTHLVAWVVPSKHAAPEGHELRGFLQPSFPEAALPVFFVHATELPTTPAGTIDRSGLRVPANVTLAEDYVAPTDHTERVLCDIWEHVLDRRPIGIETDFFAVGGSREAADRMLEQVERTLGRECEFNDFATRPTLRHLAQCLRAVTTAERPLLVPIQLGSSPPLFCIPGISGSLREFSDLASRLGPEQTVYGVQPLGMFDNETPHETIVEMAECYLPAIRQIQPQGPYYLAGYSLGGVVAFELARLLEKQGERIALLALFDAYLWGNQASLVDRLERHWNYLAQQSFNGRWRYLKARTRSLLDRWRLGAKKFDKAARFEDMDLLPARMRVAQTHMNAFRCYRPGPYQGSIVLFAAEGHADKPMDGPCDPTLGWGRWTGESVTIIPISSNHLDILEPAKVAELAGKLQATLAEVHARENQQTVSTSSA